jgi:hypothetical protein
MPKNRPNAGVWLVRNRNGTVTFVEHRLMALLQYSPQSKRAVTAPVGTAIRSQTSTRQSSRNAPLRNLAGAKGEIVSVFPGRMDYFFDVFRGISMTSGRG